MPFRAGMPADLDMILSASPPLFVHHGPFTDFRFGAPLSSARAHKLLTISASARLNAVNVKLAPIRPCLKEDPESPKDSKKRVCFADDLGLALTHVKVMSEPSDCPPRWTDAFLDQITFGVKALPVSEHRWDISFAQPASDYLNFRRRLERDCVSLENVIVREPGATADVDAAVNGTIKVRNLAFHKEVFVRFTFDRWVTHKDFNAEFVPNRADTAALNDTFTFVGMIPTSAVKFGIVEFCVGFRCEGHEYWDSNGGSNYRLITVLSKKDEAPDSLQLRFADAVTADFDRWTEFASWNHLINDSPYW